MSAALRSMRNHKERRSSSYGPQTKVGEEEEMNSDCSSGCQSGWTTYFEQSSVGFSENVVFDGAEEEEEEEGLSMVSDASSGPPLLREEDELQHAVLMANDGFKKRRVEGGKQEMGASSVLVDTATSPLFGSPKFQTGFLNRCVDDNHLDLRCSFSYAHFQDQMAYHQSFTSSKPTPRTPMSGKGGKQIW